MSQLPRRAERPEGPRLDDHPEGFSDTADTLVLLHRDEDTGITTARLVKHPTGKTMTVPLRFDPTTRRFAPAGNGVQAAAGVQDQEDGGTQALRPQLTSMVSGSVKSTLDEQFASFSGLRLRLHSDLWSQRRKQ